MYEMFMKAGPTKWALLGVSILSLYIVIQKLLYFRVNPLKTNLLDMAKNLLAKSGKEATVRELSYDHSFAAQLLVTVVQNSGEPKEVLDEAIDESLTQEVLRLEQNMGLLSTIVTAAPLLGLVGTVLGLIEIFRVASVGGVGDPTQLSGGISEALITTVSGLSIAIPSLFAHQILAGRVKKRLIVLESMAHQLAAFVRANAIRN